MTLAVTYLGTLGVKNRIAYICCVTVQGAKASKCQWHFADEGKHILCVTTGIGKLHKYLQ
jgi:hypothetical protein